jgi:hypothetical protein
MRLIQILLPLYDNAGKALPRHLFEQTARELTQRFGGVTAHTRAPVKGLWKKGRGAQRDDLVIYEVIAPRLQRSWWRSYRRQLERQFRQETILIRASTFEQL